MRTAVTAYAVVIGMASMTLSMCHSQPTARQIELNKMRSRPSSAPAADAASQPDRSSPDGMVLSFDGAGIQPQRIELTVGETVTLDVVNYDVVSHGFTIGRDIVLEDGMPMRFRTDFFRDTAMDVLYSGDYVSLPMDDSSSWWWEYWIADQPQSYAGLMVILPTPAFKLTWRHSQAWVDPFISMSWVSFEFTVTADALGEWQFGCFGNRGKHFSNGEFGRLVVTTN